MVDISFEGVFDISTSNDDHDIAARTVLGSCGSLFTIRHMNSNDQDAVCKVCLRTGDAGKDATNQFHDGSLLGKRWVLPYYEYCPQLSFVLVDSKSEVVGYALGCTDTIKFEEWMTKEYLPIMQRQYPLPHSSTHISTPVLTSSGHRDHEVIQDFHTFHGTPDVIALNYPGHIHIDIFPEHQGKSLGKPFLVSVFKAMRNTFSCHSIHLEMASSNHRALRFYSRLGLKKLVQQKDVLYLGMDFCCTGYFLSSQQNIMSSFQDKTNGDPKELGTEDGVARIWN